MSSMKENVDGLRSQIGELVERVGSGGVGRGPANADDDDDEREDQQGGATSGGRRKKNVELSVSVLFPMFFRARAYIESDNTPCASSLLRTRSTSVNASLNARE